MLEYKGFFTKVHYDDDDNVLVGEVINCVDQLAFHCLSTAELENAFHNCIDNYLAECEKLGKTAQHRNKIFVDFDDTLCLHISAIESSKYLSEYPYANSVPNRILIDWLYTTKPKYDVVLLTKASSFMLEHKKKWCGVVCPGLIDEFVGLSVDCSKKDYIANFRGDNVFIDDSAAERSAAETLQNCRVLSPQLVMDGSEICTS